MLWANSIRYFLNGWNCSKGATFDIGTPDHLIHNGKIFQLASMENGSYKSTHTLSATYYGVGELLPGPTTRNGDIFHTLDLTVARPANFSAYGLYENMWVRVTYGNNSIVARVTDLSDVNAIDLSAGLAVALGFKGTGIVTISPP